ncbi:protein of unknown function [Candidatus Methylomirabilis oxygeniifera]|uniref:Tyr recombinase domain-containing protein n=1 Tax=Methylomirabilis oxygeniifera TaxID=671143 RepID=D5MIY6_METO1|nr:protein of unknown function [Candidatus Methylomirabilis oxyfera]
MESGDWAVHELLGHRDVSTTMIYAHVLNRGAGKSTAQSIDSEWAWAVSNRKIGEANISAACAIVRIRANCLLSARDGYRV